MSRDNRDLVLECKDLRKAYGGLKALDGAHLTVADSEIVGLAGANGAGKSTMLGAIYGEVKIDAGEVWFLGQRIDGKQPHRMPGLGLGRTFQGVETAASLTVLESVACSALYGARSVAFRARWDSRDLEYVAEILELFGLSESWYQESCTLSVFLQKKLMMARALASRPRLLLIDEPCGGLTPQEADTMVGLVRKINRTGVAVLVVEHVMSFLLDVSQRLVILHGGQVIREGLPNDVCCDPTVREMWLGDTFHEGLPS